MSCGEQEYAKLRYPIIFQKRNLHNGIFYILDNLMRKATSFWIRFLIRKNLNIQSHICCLLSENLQLKEVDEHILEWSLECRGSVLESIILQGSIMYIFSRKCVGAMAINTEQRTLKSIFCLKYVERRRTFIFKNLKNMWGIHF